MQVTFIRPTLGRLADGPFVDQARMEPLHLGLLAALTPPGVDVRLLDDRVDVIDYDEPTDLVAITVETFTGGRSPSSASPTAWEAGRDPSARSSSWSPSSPATGPCPSPWPTSSASGPA